MNGIVYELNSYINCSLCSYNPSCFSYQEPKAFDIIRKIHVQNLSINKLLRFVKSIMFVGVSKEKLLEHI